MSDESHKSYKCGQCYYLDGYSRGHVTCRDKYKVNEQSTACPSFKLKELVHTCRQCKWLETPSRGRNCIERGYDENTKACHQYTQQGVRRLDTPDADLPFGMRQVNGRVMVGGVIANTFEVDPDMKKVPFVIKQGKYGILITVTPGQGDDPPRYSVKTIELDEENLPLMEEPVPGKPRIQFRGQPEPRIDDNGKLVALRFSLDNVDKVDEPTVDLDQLLVKSPSVAMDTGVHAASDVIQEMFTTVSRSDGNLDKNILSVVGEYSKKYNWDLTTRDQMQSRLRARFDV